MKITPTGSIPPAITLGPTQTGVKSDLKAKVVAMIQGQPQVNPAVNHAVDQNNISPEEMSAIVPHTEEIDKDVVLEAAEEIKEEPKVDTQLSKQFAQLARQEKAARAKAYALQEQEKALKAREEAFSVKETAPQSKVDLSKYISVDEFLDDPLKVMADTGMSYDTLTEKILNVQNTDPRTKSLISAQDARIAQLEAKLDEQAKSQVEQQQTVRKAAEKQILADIDTLVKMDPSFEMIKSTNSSRDVLELITREFDKTGILMSVEEASLEVEEYLAEEAMKLSRIGKIQSRLAKAAQPKPEQKIQAKQQTQMKTLTNANSGSRQLSAKERAILAFKGELKS